MEEISKKRNNIFDKIFMIIKESIDKLNQSKIEKNIKGIENITEFLSKLNPIINILLKFKEKY